MAKRATQRLSRLVAVWWGCLGASGCYRVTLVDDGFYPRARTPDHEEWTSFWAFGLVGQAELDIRRYCGGPAARVRTGGNAATGIVAVLTLGVYTPRKVYIYCSRTARRGLPPAAGERSPR